jgi:signal transduction histidine kinase/ligand-binding sensor domain-containing protein
MRAGSEQRRRLSRACAGVLLACVVAAAQSSYQFDRWTPDDGLPQGAVNALLQTRDGYLWLATFDGLARFDGAQFTIFNKGRTPGILSNRFDVLFEDRHGALWAATDDFRVVKYQNGAFATYTQQDGLPPGFIHQIEEDAAGNLQVVGREGIAKWQDGRFEASPRPKWTAAGAFKIDGNRLTWIAGGVFNWYSRGRLHSYSLQTGLPSLNITAMFEDQHQVVWLNTRDAGLVRVKDGQFTAYPVQYPAGGNVVAAQEDRRGNLWLAWDGGLGQLKDGKLVNYLRDFQTGNTSFYEDREGNFWIGTINGLFRARESAVNVLTRRDGLASENVYSVLEDRAGGLWFGAWGDGVTNLKDGCATQYRVKERGGTFVSSLHQDRDGHLWIGTTRRLYRLNAPVARDCKLHYLDGRNIYPELHLPENDGFWAIHQDRAGRFWFATSRGLIKSEGGQLTRYTTADGLAGDDVKAILEARDGALWFGTWGGLSRFDGVRFTSYTEADGLAGEHLRALYEDADGVLWIGSYDGGLTRFKDGRFTRYTVKDGLFNNGVFQILEDARGYFWMSSNKGISRVSKQELHDFAEGRIRSVTATAYGKTDGMLNAECNGGRQPAGWKTRDGRLWFPTAGGAAVIDPSRIEINQQPPPVVIEELRLNNEAAPFSETLVIPPEKNNSLEIRYQALSFIRPAQQRFRYRLAGVDADWVEAGPRRAAYYHQLPPGEYVFTVIAANSDGVWNAQGVSLRVVVRPWPWQTWWFRALIVIGVAGLVMLLFQRHIARLRHEQALQQEFSRKLIASLDRERKRIADDLHDEPKQYLFAIRTYARLALDELSSLRETASEIAATAAERAREIDLLAERAGVEMSSIIEDLRPYQLKELRLTAALEDWLARSNDLSSVNFTHRIDSLDGIFADEAEVNIYRLVQEGVNNIIKHSQATAATVNITCNAGVVIILIEDNGQGFAAEDLRRKPDGGLGLKLIAERAKMLGGTAVIKSEPGHGTKITLTVPEKNHARN